jgi:hypothetical protein
MIWQFCHTYTQPRFWVDERKGRKALLGREKDTSQKLDYQNFRCGFRAVASNTNARSLIASVLPASVFCGNSILINAGHSLNEETLIFITAILNSLVLDAFLRLKVSQNINMFYIYQLPVPRLTKSDPIVAPIVSRAAKLFARHQNSTYSPTKLGLVRTRMASPIPPAASSYARRLTDSWRIFTG